jgi:segregation and condensation protein B
MTRMRQKRKARGRRERASAEADALAAQAGDALEIVDDDDEPEPEPEPGAEADHDAHDDVEAAPDAAAAEADVADAEPAALDPAQLKALVEALLFATDKPLTVQRLRQLTRVPDLPRIQAMVDEIQADFASRGLVLQEVSGGYLFRTHPAYSAWVQQLIQGRPVRLSRAQLETLAIVGYRQPITRPEIDQIRGVDSGGTLKVLLDRHLIRILGKKEEPGRPLLYGTTKEFLDFFSLKDLRELPTLREYSELTEESRQVVEQVTGEPAPAAESESATAAEPATSAEPAPPPPDHGLHPPAVDVEFAVAQARIDAAVSAADALGRHPGEILTDLPDEPPADELESSDDALP